MRWRRRCRPQVCPLHGGRRHEGRVHQEHHWPDEGVRIRRGGHGLGRLQGKNAEYVALHKELRAELDKITPRRLLTAAIANWMFNRTTAEIHPYMDQLNNMSYWTRAVKNGSVNVADIAKDMQGLVDKGIPKSKLGVGIGLDYEEHRPEVDCDPQACAAKCRFAIDQGYGGVMIWAIEKDAKKSGGKQPCHDAILSFKPTDDGTTSAKGNQKTGVEGADARTHRGQSDGRDRLHGQPRLRQSLP